MVVKAVVGRNNCTCVRGVVAGEMMRRAQRSPGVDDKAATAAAEMGAWESNNVCEVDGVAVVLPRVECVIGGVFGLELRSMPTDTDDAVDAGCAVGGQSCE